MNLGTNAWNVKGFIRSFAVAPRCSVTTTSKIPASTSSTDLRPVMNPVMRPSSIFRPTLQVAMMHTLRMGRRQLCNRLHTGLPSRLFRLRYPEKGGRTAHACRLYAHKTPARVQDIGRVFHEEQDQ